MKKTTRLELIALVLLVSLMALPLMAQPSGPPPGGPGRGFMMTEDDIKRQVNDLSQNLSLSSDQEKRIMDYEMEFYTRMQVEREKMRNNQNDFNPEEMRARMMTIRDERNKKYEEILTKEQMQKYNTIQEQRRAQMQQQFQNGQQPTQQEDRPARGRGRN